MLNDTVGIETGFMTTIHAYTGDQPTLDTLHKDLYRGRAAAMSMIPTSTGAAKAIGLVLPELKGKLDGVAIRVPTPNVSVVDLKIVAKRTTDAKEINEAMKRAAEQQLKGILGYTTAPNVSIDFNHDPHSSTFHMDQTKVHERHAGARDDAGTTTSGASPTAWPTPPWRWRRRFRSLRRHGSIIRERSLPDRSTESSMPEHDAAHRAGTSSAMTPGTRDLDDKTFRTLDDVDVKGKRVLLRVDLNVPMENGRVTDATRLERVAPTITELSDKGGKVILLAHFGRPKGRDEKDR